MTTQPFASVRPLLLGLVLAASAAADAAPLRLTLDPLAAAGQPDPELEPATDHTGSVHAIADDERAFIAAPEVNFPDISPVATMYGAVGTLDEHWPSSAQPLLDEVATAGDRRLGEFAPPTPPTLAAVTDPIDEVNLPGAEGDDTARASDDDADPASIALTREALAWVVTPIVGLAFGVAWVTGRSGHRRHRRAAAR